MTPNIYTYHNPTNQTVHYRGYVKEYNGPTVTIHTCSKVHKNRLKAKDDAKLLARELKGV